MNEIELDQIIMFLRGNIELRNLLKNIDFEKAGCETGERKHLRFALQQLIELREFARIGNKFKSNFGRGNKRKKYLDMILKKEARLSDFKGKIPDRTFFRLKNDLKIISTSL